MKTSVHGRLLALALALVMVLSMLPVTALASGETATYTKVTKANELTTGSYVLMVSTGYAPGVLDGSWVTAEQPTVTDGKVEAAAGAKYVWTLTFNGSSVKLTDASGTTVAPKGGNANGIQSGSYDWGFTFDEKAGTIRFTGTGSDTVTLASNKSSGNKFRAYKNTTINAGYPCDFTLYKLESGTKRESGIVTDLTTLQAGDKVVVFNPANGKALSTEYTSYYNKGVDVTLTDGKLSGYGDTELWTLGINEDGTYTFSTSEGKKLAMGASFSSMPLDEVNTTWNISAAATKDCIYIQNAVRKNYIEWYADKGNWSSYSSIGKNEALFAQQLYYVADSASGGEEPVVTGPVADGDYVLYVPAYKKLLSSNYSGYYNTGVDMTIEDTATSVEAALTEIWTVKNGTDGTITISTSEGKKLSMDASFTSMPLDKANSTWDLKDAGNGLYYVHNTGRDAYIQWYKDKETFSAYYSIASGSEGNFAIRFVPATVQSGGETGGLPQEGDRFVIYNQNAQAVLAAQNGTESPSIEKALATVTDGKAMPENGAAVFTVEKNGDYLRFKNETYGYLCSNGTGNNAFYSLTASEDADWLVRTCSGGVGGYEMESRTAKYNGRYSQWLEYYSDSFKTYSMYNVSDYTIYSFNFYPLADKVNVNDGIVNMPVVDFGTLYDAYVGQDYSFTFNINAVFGVQGALTITVNGETYAAVEEDGAYTVTVPAAKLAAKTELAISVTGKDTKGVAISGAATVAVKDEPVIANLTPAANAQTKENKRPVISADIINAGENPTVTMTVNGETVKATFAGGKISYTPGKDLEDGRVTAVVTVTRKDGKTATATWSFTIGESQYRLYFGQLHGHTQYSDGSGSLTSALEYIKNIPASSNVQFVAFTDHSNYFDSSSNPNVEGALYDTSLVHDSDANHSWKTYKDTIAAFNAANSDIVAIGGFEMTWSGGPGHINTFNTPGVVSRNNKTLNNKTSDAGMKAYYSLLSQTEGVDTISQFNHPGKTFGNFSDFACWDAVIDTRMYLVEVGNGEGQIGAGGYYPSYEQYIMALDKGWHVAPSNNQDNHKGRWGNANDARDVVLTDDFSEEGIYNAIRARRVYATEDKNLEITYTVNDQMMGSTIATVPEKLNINVTVYDPDKSDSITKVEVVVNSGKTAYTWDKSSDLASGSLSCTLDPDYTYYFIRVTQGDGDLAVTAPVWVGETLKLGITSFESETATPVTNESLNLTTTLFNSEATDATITSITYKVGDTVLVKKTAADLAEDQKAVKATSTLALTFPVTFTTAKVYTVTAVVELEQDGKQFSFTKELELDVLDAEELVYVGIDASHHNEYVSGNYKDSMGNFGTLAAQYSIRTVQLNTSDELIAACSNPKFKMLILTAPSRRLQIDGVGAADVYSVAELEAIKAFNANGGTVVLAGWSDYYESYDYVPAGTPHMSATQNSVLEALGSSIRINDDATNDDVLNGGQTQRLYFSTYNFDSFLMDRVEFDEEHPNDVMYTERYSHYGGASIYVVDADGKPTGTVPGTVTPVVYGHSSTYSKDSDNDGRVDQKYAYKPDDERLLITATEQLEGKGLIVVSGAAFMSNFEVQYQASDNGAEKNYSNYKICENLLKTINSIKITPIGTVNKQTEQGYKYTIEGVVTANASGYDKDTAFFDCTYVQDETGGINVFPVAGNYKIGDKVRITGVTDFYQGEIELQVSSIEKIGENFEVTAREVTAKQVNDQSVLGELVKIKGVVTRIEYADGLVQTILVRDANGDVARVFIDGYITTQNEVKNLKIGCEVEATGLASYDNTFVLNDGTAFYPRIRIRNRADVVCGKVVEEHTHKFGAWVVVKEATATEDGLKERVCACGEKETMVIPATGKTPATGDNSNITTWIIIMAVAVVGIAVAIVLYFVLKKRKENK